MKIMFKIKVAKYLYNNILFLIFKIIIIIITIIKLH